MSAMKNGPTASNLFSRACWIFDMDGTLTVPAHDFEAIRAELGLPPGQPILEVLAAMPSHEAQPLHRRLDEIELDIARRAEAQGGAAALLDRLQQRGARLGILTRNSRRNAFATLRACGLIDYFEPEAILGRESAEPKPDPDGINKLLRLWRAAPDQAVMVGDYRFDLMAGKRAGTATIHVDVRQGERWPEVTDLRVETLAALLSVYP